MQLIWEIASGSTLALAVVDGASRGCAKASLQLLVLVEGISLLPALGAQAGAREHSAGRGRHEGDRDMDEAGVDARRAIVGGKRRAVGIGVILSQNLLSVFGAGALAETSQWVPWWFPG